jgi:protein-L-isoaspartate(D-aspartate) O-methyltransferase
MTLSFEPAADPLAAMVTSLRTRYGFADERVMAAMRRVWRDRFLPEARRLSDDPFGDHPVQIGWGQTVSQPYIVAVMTSWLTVRAGMRVLEVGTGSGYQAAVLAEMGAEVDSVERVPELAEWARQALDAEGYGRVRVHLSDGYGGWPDRAPYEGVLLACAPASVPTALRDQLADGGRLVGPVGVEMQQLVRVHRRGTVFDEEYGIGVRFVPMVPTGKPA